MNTRYKRIAIVAVLVLILIILGSVLLRKHKQAPQITFDNLTQIPGNADLTRVEATDGSTYFSNGRYFVSYSTSDGTSTPLSSTQELTKILSLKRSPDGKYIAFQTESTAIALEPFKSIAPSRDDQNTRKWWILNTATQEIRYATTDSDALFWKDNTDYVYGSGTSLFEASVNSGKINTIYEGKGIVKALGVVDSTIYFNENGVQIGTIGSDGKATKIYDAGTAVDVSKKQGCFFYRVSDDQTDNTINRLVNCGSKREQTLDGDIISSKFSDDGNYFFYYTLDEKGKLQGKYIELATSHEGDWQLNLNSDNKDIELIDVKDIHNTVVRIGSFFYTQTNKGVPQLETNSSYKLDSMLIDLDKNSQAAIVSKPTAYTSADKTAVSNYLKSKGINVDVIEIKFTVITTDDDRWS